MRDGPVPVLATLGHLQVGRVVAGQVAGALVALAHGRCHGCGQLLGVGRGARQALGLGLAKRAVGALGGTATGHVQVQVTVHGKGDRTLRGLEVLGHVGIEVVLAVEHRVALDLAISRETGLDDTLDGALVGHRQGAGQAQAHRAHVGVGSSWLSLQLQNILVSSAVKRYGSPDRSRPPNPAGPRKAPSLQLASLPGKIGRDGKRGRTRSGIGKAALQGAGKHKQLTVLKGRTNQLGRNGQLSILAQAQRHRDATVAADVERNGVQVGEVHLRGVADLAKLKGRARRGRHEDGVHLAYAAS